MGAVVLNGAKIGRGVCGGRRADHRRQGLPDGALIVGAPAAKRTLDEARSPARSRRGGLCRQGRRFAAGLKPIG